MNGQLTLFEYAEYGQEAQKGINANNPPMVPIWHCSLSCVWCECPSCKTQPDNLVEHKISHDGKSFYNEYKTECPHCGQPILWDWDLIDKAAKKSKDYIACEKLGLSGAVKKDDKGNWVQA